MKEKIKQFLKGIGFLLLFIFGPALVLHYLIGFGFPLKKIGAMPTQIGIQILLCVTFFLIYRKTLINDFKNIKKDFRNNFNITIKYWIYGLLIMAGSNIIINFLINHGNIAGNENSVRNAFGNMPIYTILAASIFAPFTEELTFRAGFKKAFTNPKAFAIFSGLLFGLAHVFNGLDFTSMNTILSSWKEFFYIIPYGALGYAFAYIYSKTDNVCFPMLAHCFHNSLSMILLIVATFLERFV